MQGITEQKVVRAENLEIDRIYERTLTPQAAERVFEAESAKVDAETNREYLWLAEAVRGHSVPAELGGELRRVLYSRVVFGKDVRMNDINFASYERAVAAATALRQIAAAAAEKKFFRAERWISSWLARMLLVIHETDAKTARRLISGEDKGNSHGR